MTCSLLRPLSAALALAIVALVSTLGAQAGDPGWQVTFKPSTNPMPAGQCNAVSLSLYDEASRGIPRNPAGTYISMADFDMSVTADDPRTVFGKYNGSTSYSVCACQAATVGSAVIVSATYPAKALAEKLRVPAAQFQKSMRLTIKDRVGTTQPTGCDDLKTTVVAANTPPLLQRPPVEPAQPARTSPISRPAPAAQPPTNVAVSGTPGVARLTWSAVPNATRYAVWRAFAGAASAERTPALFTQTEWRDTVPDPALAYRYTVVAYYADGSSGEAPAVAFTSPRLANPASASATWLGFGNVRMTWTKVAGASKYRLDGTGLSNTGLTVLDTSQVLNHVPNGPGNWKVTAMYPGNFADYAGGTSAALMIRSLPNHSVPWLSKNNGVGALWQVQMPADPFDPLAPCGIGDYCPEERNGVLPGDLAPYGYFSDEVAAAKLAWLVVNSIAVRNRPRPIRGIRRWLNVPADFTLWNEGFFINRDAAYGNPLDLGVGRRANCTQFVEGPPRPGMKTVCWASAYGIPPGQPGFNDPAQIVHTLDGHGDGPLILTMLIVKDSTGTSFFVFKPSDDFKYNLSPTVNLDTEGPKVVPFACLSCHGGTYNATTRKVDGSSFLPLNPGLLSFESSAEQAAQEEKIRKINLMIHDAQPRSAIASYLNELYKGAIATPGTRAQADYVPSGWSEQAGLYRQVVRPYSSMCHLAGPPSWNFATWKNFEDNKALVHGAVCGSHTMPHAEVPFKSFWLKDTGALYLPGLLATSLGFPAC